MARGTPKSTKHEYKSTQNYNYDIKPGETDLQYYRRLAKTADQRLVRLEALKHDEHFKGAEKWAYARAMRDIEAYGGGKRFNTKPPESRSLFNEKIADMLRFLKSPTSTKKGITEVYQKRADTLNEKYDMVIKWQDLANLSESGALDKMLGDFGSDTAFKSIGKITKNREQIQEMIDAEKDRDLSPEEMEQSLVERYGIDIGSPLDNSVESILENEELMKILMRS